MALPMNPSDIYVVDMLHREREREGLLRAIALHMRGNTGPKPRAWWIKRFQAVYGAGGARVNSLGRHPCVYSSTNALQMFRAALTSLSHFL